MEMEMEMEGSGGTGTGTGTGSQSQLTHPAVDVDEAALAVTNKRARKRSRYLSPPYTDTGVQEKRAAGGHKQREEEEEEEEEGPPPHVSASEVLSALRAAALGQGEGTDAAALRFLSNRNGIFVGHKQREVEEEGPPHVSASEVLSALQAAALGQWEGMDAAALRFLSSRNSIFVAGGGSQDDGGIKPPSAAGVGRSLSAGPDDGSLSKNNKRKNPKNPHPAAAAGANAKQQKVGAMENAAVPPEHAIAVTHGHPNPPVVTTATPPINDDKTKRRRMNKKRRIKTAGQHSYVGNPVALVLDLAAGTPLPSREDLLSTFSRFGFVIDSETTISQDKHTARVAFATRAQAEAALSCAATLDAAFGPPFAVASLQDLPPITPLPKLPLTDIRNNLGKMILALSSKATAAAAPANSPQEANAKTTAVDSLSLVGEMQHLLAKVDKVLQVQRASATAHHA